MFEKIGYVYTEIITMAQDLYCFIMGKIRILTYVITLLEILAPYTLKGYKRLSRQNFLRKNVGSWPSESMVDVYLVQLKGYLMIVSRTS